MNKIDEITRINKAAAALEQETFRVPSTAQLAEYLEMTETKVSDALQAAPWVSSLDVPFCGEDDYSLLDRIPANNFAADQALMSESFSQEINAMLSALSEKERTVIELTYGMTGGLEMSPADISPHVGLSPETVRRIRNAALQKLRCNSYSFPVNPGNRA
jgi:RNA polymerase primary sigma factor